MQRIDAYKNTVRSLLSEVWSNGDLSACDRLLAAKYTVFHDPGDPWDQRELDLAGYKERVTQSRAPFPDQAFSVQEILGEGEKVVVSWMWNATHRGDLPGFPASNKRIAMSGITIYSFENGLVSGHWQLTDRLGVYAQLRQG